MMLAAELVLARVDVVVVERRATPELASARGRGLHARTIELLDQRGIADRFLSKGQRAQVAAFGGNVLDISDFPTRHSYGLALVQSQFELILAEWCAELGVPFIRGCDVTGFTRDADGVNVALSDGRSLRAQWLVGCDGGRSVIRKAAGIDFPGWDASISYIIAEATMTEPAYGLRRDDKGTFAIGPGDDKKRVGVVLRDERVEQGEPSEGDLRDALVALYGADFGVRDVTYLSRFSDATRQAASYRDGRVLLAGDAAHVHSPMGGQGLNLGIHDAINLGWKLACVVHGASDALLDTYQAERHPITARVLRTTMAQTALSRGDERTKALGETVAEILRTPEARKRWAGFMSGLDIRYDLGEGHPLLGRRMPDLDIETESGPTRVFTLLHRAEPVLLSFGAPLASAINARYTGKWELPVIGEVAPPSAVLVRPDGYVAWVGEGSDAGLADARAKWFMRSAP
jgi:2-polyprenyl-6-methoxyphenol hydroxylase-like FAD-dependent oxidoreductase